MGGSTKHERGHHYSRSKLNYEGNFPVKAFSSVKNLQGFYERE
jgi:hypothetical protein